MSRDGMLTLIEQKLAKGESATGIVQFFVAQYGEQVLSAPTKKGFNLTAWITPFVAILAGACRRIPIFEYSPLEIKQAVVGYGRAEKGQVQKMVKAILQLSQLPQADAADALAVAICHINFLKVRPI